RIFSSMISRSCPVISAKQEDFISKEVIMAATIPDQYKDLFQKKAFCNLATLMPDGRPQVSPVWCDLDGSTIRINSAKGRVKDKNMRRKKKVALSVFDPDNPYRHLAFKGEVVEITEMDAVAHIDDLSKIYMGIAKFS